MYYNEIKESAKRRQKLRMTVNVNNPNTKRGGSVFICQPYQEQEDKEEVSSSVEKLDSY